MSKRTEGAEPDGSLDEAASTFVELRPRLFGIAYRVLGGAAEADDVVQEVWLRWQDCERSAVDNPPAFLAMIATRLSLNALRAAKARRETYVGPWLPEPVDTSADPALGAERGEALELALLLLLERLTPTQRAAYILREAFDHPYEQIAEILELTPENARQLVRRARTRLAAERHAAIDAGAHRRLTLAFLAAAHDGDVGALKSLFAADIASRTDGDGRRGAARFPLLGADRVARFVAGMEGPILKRSKIELVEVNGRAGALIDRPGRDLVLFTFEASHLGVHQLLWYVGPKIDRFLRTSPREPWTA
ncbi:RNA polymerase sigma-70 factor [Actinocorallia aurea]